VGRDEDRAGKRVVAAHEHLPLFKRQNRSITLHYYVPSGVIKLRISQFTPK